MATQSQSRTPPPRPGTATSSSRPRIKIKIPPPCQPHQAPYGYFNPASPFLSTAHSHPSQLGSGAPQWPPTSPYINPFTPSPYPPKSSEFLKQFGGFKDFTWDWTKTGLNKGEKSAFYIYDKVSKWSRKWFTHIFLITVVFLYSVAGAYIFMGVEGARNSLRIPRFVFCSFVFVLLGITKSFDSQVISRTPISRLHSTI